jgi:enoyl-CoA hydratase/carnithine racemase
MPDHILTEREGDFVTITMNRPRKRNALSLAHMAELTTAFREAGESDARGVILAANGPAFSAGHDFAEMVGADLAEMRRLFRACTVLMETMQSIPQVVIARVHAVATAAGCQLVATADLAVAAETATFVAPGGSGGLFCHTPMVAIGRNIGRKRALELSLTGDPIDARTAAEWGLVNRVVPLEDLEAETMALLHRATRGSPFAKGVGKQGFYSQIGLDQPRAYDYASEVMAAGAAGPEGQEWMASFLERREARYAR